MKMLVFVISLGVLYWAMTSYAQTQLTGGAPCSTPENLSSAGFFDVSDSAAPATSSPLAQFASADVAEAPSCER